MPDVEEKEETPPPKLARAPSESEAEFAEHVRRAISAGNAAIIDDGCYVVYVASALSPAPSCEFEKVDPFDAAVNRGRAFLGAFSAHIGIETEESEAHIASLEGSFLGTSRASGTRTSRRVAVCAAALPRRPEQTPPPPSRCRRDVQQRSEPATWDDP